MNKIIIVILVILALVLGGFVLFSNQSPFVSNIEDSGTQSQSPSVDGSSDVDAGENGVSDDATLTTVTYTVGGFSPSEVTVNAGDTVRFMNQTGGTMWVASAVHPAHAVYDGTSLSQHCAAGATPSFDQCSAGDAYSFTFDKAGTWKYHDHLHASKIGTVIVR